MSNAVSQVWRAFCFPSFNILTFVASILKPFFFFSLGAFRMVSPHFLCRIVICFSAGGRGIAVQLLGRFRVCVVTLRPLAHPSAFDLGSSTQLCNLTVFLMRSPAPPPRFLGAAGRCSGSTRIPVCRAPSLRVGRPWVGS